MRDESLSDSQLELVPLGEVITKSLSVGQINLDWAWHLSRHSRLSTNRPDSTHDQLPMY